MEVAIHSTISERMMAATGKTPEPGVASGHTSVVSCNFKVGFRLHRGIAVQASNASSSLLEAPICGGTQSRESSRAQPATPEGGRLAWAEPPGRGGWNKSSC